MIILEYIGVLQSRYFLRDQGILRDEVPQRISVDALINWEKWEFVIILLGQSSKDGVRE